MRPFLTALAGAVALCILLGACGKKDQAQQAQQPSKALEEAKKDEALMEDLDHAGPELERRLAESVSVDGNLLLVHADPFLYVLPVSTPWTIQCFAGMSIVFGNSISGDNSSTNNEVEVDLAAGIIHQKNCEILAPRVGKRLLAILGQDTH